jgi:hypothetical protein
MGCDLSWLQVAPERAPIVVLVGNIGKFSLVVRQPGKGLSLQTKRLTDDDPGAAFAAGGRPRKKVSSAGQEKEIRR